MRTELLWCECLRRMDGMHVDLVLEMMMSIANKK
jgi:hypothetical protein